MCGQGKGRLPGQTLGVGLHGDLGLSASPWVSVGSASLRVCLLYDSADFYGSLTPDGRMSECDCQGRPTSLCVYGSLYPCASLSSPIGICGSLCEPKARWWDGRVSLEAAVRLGRVAAAAAAAATAAVAAAAAAAAATAAAGSSGQGRLRWRGACGSAVNVLGRVAVVILY